MPQPYRNYERLAALEGEFPGIRVEAFDSGKVRNVASAAHQEVRLALELPEEAAKRQVNPDLAAGGVEHGAVSDGLSEAQRVEVDVDLLAALHNGDIPP